MCNYNFRQFYPQSPRYTSSHHQNKNPPKVSFIPIHIKVLHKKKSFGKKFSLSAGIEPATYGLEIRCSIQLSYESDKISPRSDSNRHLNDFKSFVSAIGLLGEPISYLRRVSLRILVQQNKTLELVRF